jgi:hypothetical protein
LIERTEALLVKGAVDHEPVGRIGIGQHRLRDRDEGLRKGTGSAQQQASSRQHRCGVTRCALHVFLPVSPRLVLPSEERTQARQLRLRDELYPFFRCSGRQGAFLKVAAL